MIVVAAFEAPAVVAGFHDVAMVSQAIEKRGGHLGVAEHAGLDRNGFVTEAGLAVLYLAGECIGASQEVENERVFGVS